MITIKDKKECSGCAVCASVCKNGCIDFITDKEGFVYPQIESYRCVDCGLCNRVCPMLNIPKENNIAMVIAAKNNNKVQRASSSSGGVFYLLSKLLLEDGGFVVGCRFDNQQVAMHDIATTMEAITPFMSSKYVQSDTNSVYEKVKRLLNKEKKVLFSGTPCQVAALKNFLVRPYPNLITLDILCHGVPSPVVFKEYLTALEKRYGSKVVSVNFRSKEKSWKRLYINILFKNKKRHFLYAGYDSYMQLFLSDRLQRPSCFHCPYNTLNRPGDISLGDFWGIGKTQYKFDDDKGVSLVLINSETGKKFWSRIADNTVFLESDVDTAVAGNKVLVQHLPSSKKRDEFYAEYVTNGFEAAIAKFAPEASIMNQLYHNFMRCGLDLLRKIKHESY